MNAADFRRASPAAAWRRGWTAARPSAPAAARSTMARAMATRCCWPPDSWPGSLSTWRFEPDEWRGPRRRAFSSRRAGRPACAGRSRHCRARSCAGTARSSGTPCRSRALRAPSVSMRVSSSQIEPRVGASRPARQFSAVDLPQPDGPSRAMNSPRLIENVTSFSALSRTEIAAEVLQAQGFEGLQRCRHGVVEPSREGREAMPAAAELRADP